MDIRFMKQADLDAAAQVHQQAFIRQRNSYEWLQCNLNAFPRFLCFVVEVDDDIAGYIIWVQKSGFRPEAIMEIEQLAVLPRFQGQGIGRKLLTESLSLVKAHLSDNGSTLKHIMVTTRADNFAQQLYKSALGAEVEATISNLYSADEVWMVARNM